MHGSLGSIEAVAGIEPFLADTNLLFIDLPGSGKTAAPAEISVEGFAEELIPALRKLVPGDFRILGVSFGGTVALAVARRLEGCKGVVLLDSPFSAQKLWHNHLFLRGMIEREPDNSFIRNFALRIYGVTEHAAVERDYWYLLDALKIPVTVVTGDVAMMPVRPVPPVPCCLDGGDLERLQSLGAKVVRISGGHDLINDNTADVAQVVKAF
jgi:pimeloyl-ACP methyl ester carboxylesterase